MSFNKFTIPTHAKNSITCKPKIMQINDSLTITAPKTNKVYFLYSFITNNVVFSVYKYSRTSSPSAFLASNKGIEKLTAKMLVQNFTLAPPPLPYRTKNVENLPYLYLNVDNFLLFSFLSLLSILYINWLTKFQKIKSKNYVSKLPRLRWIRFIDFPLLDSIITIYKFRKCKL